MVLYGENSKDSSQKKNFLKLKTEFKKIQDTKPTLKNHLHSCKFTMSASKRNFRTESRVGPRLFLLKPSLENTPLAAVGTDRE